MLVGFSVLFVPQQTRSPIPQRDHIELGLPKLRVLYLHGDDRLLSVRNILLRLADLVVLTQAQLSLRWENKRRDKVEGGAPAKGTVLNVIEDHDLAVGFRYIP